MTMNLLLNFAELAVIQILMYYFLSSLPRDVYRAKWCYPAVFLLSAREDFEDKFLAGGTGSGKPEGGYAVSIL